MDQTDTTPRIRKISVPHIGQLIQIATETNLSPWTAQNYLDELQTDNTIMLCLEAAPGEIVGFIVGRLVCGTNAESRDAEIYNLAVVEASQRQGLGQQLFDEFAVKCRTSNAQNIWLEVRESNAKAISFYSRNGFERIQSRPNFYENPREHAVLMRLSLKKLDA